MALERDGTLRLYSVNGGAPAEVGHLVVGRLDEAHAAIVAAAFSDLREAVTNGQLARPEPERTMPRALPVASPVAKLAKPAKGVTGRRYSGAPSLNGRIRDYLRQHGGRTTAELYDALKPESTPSKSDHQRLGTALHSLKHQGHLTRGTDNRWHLRDGP